MSGAQGMKPANQYTATAYESKQEGQNKTKTDIRSKEDEGGIEIKKIQDEVKDPLGTSEPSAAFGSGDVEQKQDPGVTGTG